MYKLNHWNGNSVAAAWSGGGKIKILLTDCYLPSQYWDVRPTSTNPGGSKTVNCNPLGGSRYLLVNLPTSPSTWTSDFSLQILSIINTKAFQCPSLFTEIRLNDTEGIRYLISPLIKILTKRTNVRHGLINDLSSNKEERSVETDRRIFVRCSFSLQFRTGCCVVLYWVV